MRRIRAGRPVSSPVTWHSSRGSPHGAFGAAVLHQLAGGIAARLSAAGPASWWRLLPKPAQDMLSLIDPVQWPHLVTAAGLAVFLLASVPAIGWWVPRRMRWHRRASAAHALAASEDGRELLALRALMRPLDDVGRTATLTGATPGRLAEGWRDADPATLEALAGAELRRLGLGGASTTEH
ncbi:hypothetical protein [Streptomyces sp. SolWspMP-sol7th]|uniref:hypothetical protein n=1 Tax=Streptomyces sp. SolWspMP-sol7th TaxID=1839776 RepID=UPI0020C78F90|nr:hypothetical protein [Streptomyces sp. SolWspMP-sol7th]